MNRGNHKNSIGVRDVSWGIVAVLYRLALNLMPMWVHWRFARARGTLYRTCFGTPDFVIENLRQGFPRLPSQVIQEIATLHVEFRQQTDLERILPLLRDYRTSKGWRIEGEPYLRRALQAGRGVLLLTAHFGYARLIEPTLRFAGYDAVRVVAKSNRGGLERAQRWQEWVRDKGPFRRALVDRFLLEILRPENISAQLDIRPILKALSGNRSVVVAGDGLVGTSFLPMPLLDQRFPFAIGYMKIADMTGCPVIPVFAEEEEGVIVLRLYPPLKTAAEIGEAIREWAQVLGEQLTKTPHLWTRWGNRNMWRRALEWSEKDAGTRYMRHSPWGKEE